MFQTQSMDDPYNLDPTREEAIVSEIPNKFFHWEKNQWDDFT